MKCCHKPTFSSFIHNVRMMDTIFADPDRDYCFCKQCGKKIRMVRSNRKPFNFIRNTLNISSFILFFVLNTLLIIAGWGKRRILPLSILVVVYLCLMVGLNVYGLYFAKYYAVKIKNEKVEEQ